MRFSLRTAAGMALALAALSTSVRAQTWPNQSVHVIVAYAAGGTGDVVARVVADKLAAALRQSVVVENRAGGSGAIGAQAVAHASPDGYTLLLGQTGEIAVNQHLLKGLNYDPDKDLQPVALAAVGPLALVVPANSPYSTMAELYKAMKTEKITFASAGTGTPGYFAGEMLKLKTGGNLTHVPYKGAGPALNDVVGGHVDFYFPGFPPAMPLVKAGSIKLLAVSSAKRSPAAPDIPTVGEVTGFSDYDFTLWQGYFAPAGTPKDVVARLNKEINAILVQPDVRDKLAAAGADVMPITTEAFVAFVKTESAKYERIIKEAGVTVE